MSTTMMTAQEMRSEIIKNKIRMEGATQRMNINETAIYNVLSFGAVGDGIADDTRAIQLAIDAASANGGGQVYIPSGTYKVTPPELTRVAQDEGACFILDSTSSNIHIKGADKDTTIIKPASNKIEVFSQNGASNIKFSNIKFDNTANTRLTRQVKPGTLASNGGVTGNGNGANAAIRQFDGDNLTVDNCSFFAFDTAIYYLGDTASTSVGGDVTVTNSYFFDCVFGLLTDSPENVWMSDCSCEEIQVSYNVGSQDPGHILYVANRSSAAPNRVTLLNIIDKNSKDDTAKIRKGGQVIVNNIISQDCTCLSLENVRNAIVTNLCAKVSATASVYPEGARARTMRIVDCGDITVSNVHFDIRGAESKVTGLEMFVSTDDATWKNNNVKCKDFTILTDGCKPLLINGVDNPVFENFIIVNDSATALTYPPFFMLATTGARIINPVYRTSSTDGESIVYQGVDLSVNTTGTYVSINRPMSNLTTYATTLHVNQDSNQGSVTYVFEGVSPYRITSASSNDTTLMACWDASKLTGANGSLISSVPDQSANSNTMVQATTANQPKLITSAIAGRQAMQFFWDGINSSALTLADNTSLNWSTIHMFMVIQRVTDTGAGEHILSKYNNLGNEREYVVSLTNDSARVDFTYDGTNQTGAELTNDLAVGKPTLIEVVFNSDNTFRIYQRVNGVDYTKTATLPSAPYNGTSALWIGSRPTGLTLPFSGYVGEIRLYNQVKSNRIAIANSLCDKWGVA